MTLVVGSVVDGARDRHVAFDRNRIPAKMARRFLSTYARELAGKVEQVDETALLVDQDTAMPLTDFTAGITLPANRYVAAVVGTRSDDAGCSFAIDLIPWGQRNSYNTRIGSAWIVNGKLYLSGSARMWTNVTNITVAYAPIMDAFESDTDEIPLPDTADLALQENLALYMARRGHSDPRLPAINLGMFTSVAMAAEANFLADVMNRVAGEHFRVVDVWGES